MNSLLGFLFVMVGLTSSVAGALAGVYALTRGAPNLLRTVYQWAWMVLVGAVGAFTVMEVAVFQRDYSVSYVQRVGSDTIPPLFNFAALWSALEGSLLLWTLVLAFFTAAKCGSKRRLNPTISLALVFSTTAGHCLTQAGWPSLGA